MRKLSVVMFIVIAPILFSINTCLAGAWGMQKGKLYERLSFNYYYADEDFDKDGDRVGFGADGHFRDVHMSNYIEYGLLDNLTIINSVYYKDIRNKDDNLEQKTSGIGDIDLGAKVQIMKLAGGLLSSQALVKIPVAYDKNDDLPLGNGQFDLEARLLYGRSLYPYVPGYCNIELGYRFRFEAPSDELRYLLEVGADFTKNFYGRVKLDGIFSMDNGKHSDSGGNPTTTNNYDIGKLDIALGYKINKQWGIEAGYTPAVYGKYTTAGSTYTIAVTLQNL
jgi:protein XagA